jgi:hypothetical protein
MYSRWLSVGLLTVALLATFSSGLPSTDPFPLVARDGHGHHMHHKQPLLELNETEWNALYSPTLPSYWTIDVVDHDPDVSRHPELMAMHGVLMCLAFFVALPISISLRSVRHRWRELSMVAFYGLAVLGCGAGALYSKLTPDMYEGSIHGTHGNLILLFALSLSLIDFIALVRRVITFFRPFDKFSFRSFWKTAIRNQEPIEGALSEYASLVHEDSEEFEKAEFNSPRGSDMLNSRRLESIQSRELVGDPDEHPAEWANEVGRHRIRDSLQSNGSGTLFGPHSPALDDSLNGPNRFNPPKKPFLRRAGRFAFATGERALVLAGFGQLLSGIVVYTGGCRGPLLNICLAHLIKGGIFWAYGLLTFSRFLGSYSDLGWAWNRIPSGDYPSAEFVESLVIFIYGITNTWMERFGAKPGDRYTTKQLQHIGIAVMFWFAGLVGMGLESKRVRRWLASSAAAALNSSNITRDVISEPPSYLASFNPFPALVIGVTGAAMAAHAQTYLFQVQIHSLWGNLLLGFSVMRSLTYFFLWLGPPRSILPSRPPTEALGSFFLACGGLVFMMSTEELTIAAMRQGRDDVMMFLNVAVAITCFSFCWILAVVAFKGWLKSHTHPSVSYHSSA